MRRWRCLDSYLTPPSPTRTEAPLPTATRAQRGCGSLNERSSIPFGISLRFNTLFLQYGTQVYTLTCSAHTTRARAIHIYIYTYQRSEDGLTHRPPCASVQYGNLTEKVWARRPIARGGLALAAEGSSEADLPLCRVAERVEVLPAGVLDHGRRPAQEHERLVP